MNGEVRPVNQFFVDLIFEVNENDSRSSSVAHLLKSLGVVIRQFDFLPHASRCMRSFDGFDVQVHDAYGVVSQCNINRAKSNRETFMLANSGISGVCQWT